METITNALPIINLLGVLVIGVFTIVTSRSMGRDSVQKDVLGLYEKQILALKGDADLTRKRNHDLGNQIQVLSLKVGLLEGQLQEKDKKIDEYMHIFQNRNPQIDDFMAVTTSILEGTKETTRQAQHYMETTGLILSEIRDFMKQLNDKALTNQSRNESIDSSTEASQGNVMRNVPQAARKNAQGTRSQTSHK